MEYLQGGRDNKIVRFEAAVHRPSGFWSPAVHALLNHIRVQGFFGAPLPLGFDDNGREVLTFIPGHVSNYPLSAAAASFEALTSAAQLLRTFHDATVSFLDKALDTATFAWLLPTREPAEVVCHGDFAPYNVVLDGAQAMAIIDFDTAHPAPRVWDIAYALYRWAPLTNPANPDGFGTMAEQLLRASLFCDAYGLSCVQRRQLPGLIIERLDALVNFIFSEAQSGNEAFQANIKEGHHLLYLADRAYLKQHQAYLEEGLAEKSATNKTTTPTTSHPAVQN
jgi:Ser/Thr protein kinase RdoA (MazF antagonist)